ncbi:hypothetical protein Q1695_007949 [Nippostrongylus brasiliensis]|nr:hypothetical protein Q1695_007949 [Nippostrongylus brasiliensis]
MASSSRDRLWKVMMSVARAGQTAAVHDQAEVTFLEDMVKMEDTYTSATPPPFDLATFLTGALQLGGQGHMLSAPSNSSTSTNRLTTSPSSDVRKRRRGEIMNLANTLDGLVARRADDTDEPFKKRYLAEQEAIEGPDDEAEAKKMESDPDVSTRTCSTCGYVGKWISEMIRHKRVHTNERPFKCRYCSRTSKWKADLIRHVAKTHGIRVVSKYSRSKAFDQTITNLTNRDDEDKPRIFACEPDKEPERQKLHQHSTSTERTSEITRPEPFLPRKAPLSYRCLQCFFENAGLSVLIYHLRVVHNKCPYECRCRVAFTTIGDALSHSSASPSCSSDDLVLNIAPIYRTTHHTASISSSESMSPTRSRSGCSPDSGVQCDMDEVDAERTSIVQNKADTCELEIEGRLDKQSSSLLLSPCATSTNVFSSLDFSAALLSLQFPLVPDFFTSVAGFLQSTSLMPVVERTPSHECVECGSQFSDIDSFIAHSRLHSSILFSMAADVIQPSTILAHAVQSAREELVDVER